MMTFDQIERMLELTASLCNELGTLVIETKRHNQEMERLATSIQRPIDGIEWRNPLERHRETANEWPIYNANGKVLGSVRATTREEASILAVRRFGNAAYRI